MAINSEAKKAHRASNALLRKVAGDTRRIYITATDKVAAEVKKLKTMGKGVKYKLTIASEEALMESLKKESAILRVQINSLATKGTSKAAGLNAGRYGKYTYGFMSKVDTLDNIILNTTLAKVNTDLVTVQLLKTYGDGLTYSNRIWRSSKLFSRDLRNIVAEGIARNRDMIAISKDLNVYVRKGKEAVTRRFASIDSSPRRPDETMKAWKTRVTTYKARISGRVEYNSLRIVRTQIQGAIQDCNITAQSYTPSVQTFNWNLSPAHKVYSICEDIEAGNPHTYEGFEYDTPPHVNCLSYVTYNEKPQREFTSDLKKWSKNPSAPGTGYLNDWKQNYYDPTAMSDNTNFFTKILARNNKEGVGSLRRAA